MDNFEEYIAELKRTVDLVSLIQEDEPLTQRGREWRGTHHDSLQVSPDTGLWHWWALSVGGDGIRWVEWKRGLDFKSAVELLTRKAGMDAPQWSEASAQARLAAQARYDAFEVAANFYQRKLEESEVALRYCSRRGWTPETTQAEQIGFFGSDYDGLRAEFKMRGIDLGSPVAVALVGFRGNVRRWATAHNVDLAGREKWLTQGYVPGMPRNMLVYPHVEWGRVRYFSARSPALVWEDEGAFVVWDALTDEETRFEDRREAHRAGKRHYNLPRELAGDKPVCWNSRAVPGKGKIVLVEGQADKVTLAQWKIPAMALLRTALDDTEAGRQLAKVLGAHDLVYAGVDSDAAGVKGVRDLARVVGPRLRVVRWPDHDVNDWLMASPEAATAEAAAALLQAAPLYAEVLAEWVGGLPDADRADGVDELLDVIIQMRPSERAIYRKQIAKGAEIGLAEYDKLVKLRLERENEREEQPDDTITAVGGTIGDSLLEMIYEPPLEIQVGAITLGEGKTRFAVRDGDGQIEVMDSFSYEGKRYAPMMPNPMIKEQAVRFAPCVGDVMDTRQLVRAIQATINKYVDIDIFYETLAAYYVLFTWVYDVFESLPYLRVKGDTGTGKSRFQQVVGSMCFRPMMMNAGASISSMFRTMHRFRGTLILDEADFQQSDEASAIAKLLNIGYQRRQGFIYRSGDKNKDFETEMFLVFGPKVIATRKEYNDKAIESRCLTREMSGPTTRTDIVRNLPDTFWNEEIPELQALLLRYRLDHWSPRLNENGAHAMDGLQNVEPRLQQIITPLMKIIEDENLLADLGGFVRAYNKQMIAERGMTVAAKILEALYILSEMQKDEPISEQDFSLGTIAEIANDLMDFENDRPISKWVRFVDKAKFKISAKGAGRTARKALGLHSERRGASRRFQIVMDMVRLDALWRRYGYDSDDARVALLNMYFEIQGKIQEYESTRAPTLL